MRLLKISIFLTICFTLTAYSTNWVLVGTVPGSPGLTPSISVGDLTSVWVVGGTSGSPKVFKSTNGGYNWTQVQTAGISQILNCVAGFTAQTAYVAEGEINGGAGLYRTTNGGTNWTLVFATGPNKGFINGLAFTKANGNLFGLAIAEKIYRSSNAGLTWIELNSAVVGVSNAQNSLFIVDNNFYGFGLNNGAARVRLTENNATSWTTQQINLIGSYTSAIAYHSNKMMGLSATSESMPLLARTTDEGNTWSEINIGPGVIGNCFLNWIPNGPVVYIMGENGGIKRSTDNGLTWVTTPTPVNNIKHFDFMQYNNIVIGYAVSSDGKIIKLVDTLGVLTGTGTNNSIPNEFSLKQNYPNPFNPVTLIEYSIAKESIVNITVYDALGREIGNLVNENKKAGNYSITFDGSNVNSGVYFYKISAGDFSQTRKMILLK